MRQENQFSAADLFFAPLLDVPQLGHQFGASLIVAPHPDDEALGCGGFMRHLRLQHVPVTVVFMTSGGASHPNSLEYPSDKLAALRESEALASCNELGVEPDQVLFYHQPDGALEKLSSQEIDQLSTQLASDLTMHNISTLFLPWRRDVHPDHIMSHKIGMAAVHKCRQEILVVEYPVWLWKRSNPTDWPWPTEISLFRLKIDDVYHQKQQAIFQHQSQTTALIQDDPEGFILSEDLLSPFSGNYEYFFINKNQAMEALGQEFFDTLYSENEDPWNFRYSAYEHEKYRTVDQLLEDQTFENGLELGCSIGIQTPFFAKRCQNLLAVDISEDAIASAIHNNPNLHNVVFQVLDVVESFPPQRFDFISMAEVGYYFDESTLYKVFAQVDTYLQSGGQFLMVHWTSFVREFPLNGNQVNSIFKDYNALHCHFSGVSSFVHDKYEVYIWQKK